MLECAVFGGLLLDRYYEVDRFPQRGQDAVILGEFDAVGGCAINMAVTFNNLGGKAHIVSSIGSGPIGRAITDYLERHNLSRRFLAPVSEDSGSCDVYLEPGGERTFFTRKGFAKRYPADIVDGHLHGICCAAATGYYLMEEPDAVAASLERFVQEGGLLLYDPGPLVERIDPAAQEKVLKAASVITANAVEAQFLCLHRIPDKLIVIKKGAAGGTVRSPEGSFDYAPAPAAVVDTTGAGDSFDAGLLFGLAGGMDLRGAVALGAKCAAKTVGIVGPHGFWEV